jgi:integrase
MFKFPTELVTLHRNIEKLPKVKQFLSPKESASVYHNLGYKTSLAYLQQFLDVNHSSLTLETIIESISTNNVDIYRFLGEFVAFLQTKRLSRSSIVQYLTSVKAYLQYHDVDIVPYKFKKRVTLPKIPREEARPIDQNDTRTILLHCKSVRLKAFILVLASSGVRATEACAIRVCDIDISATPTKIHIRAEYTKTKCSRNVFISDEATSYLKELIEHRFRIKLHKDKNINKKIGECLVFQVQDAEARRVSLHSIYCKLVQQFHDVLDDIDSSQRRDGMQHRRQITFHSFRRLVKTTIADAVGSDYSEWYLGHNKSTYYVSKPEVRAKIYKDKCMKYLTFLDYSTLEVAGKNMEAKIYELEKEKQIMGQKYEEQMNAMQLQMNRIMEMIQYNPKLARLKQSALTRLANKK